MLADRALLEGHKILDLDNYAPEEMVNGVVVRAKHAIINTALTTLAKVDENQLRKTAIDRMPMLMKLVAEVDATLPPPGQIDLEADQ